MRAAALLAAALLAGCSATEEVTPPEDPSTQVAAVGAEGFLEKVTAGYQGWFTAAGDGTEIGWTHWGPGSTPGPNAVRFEVYPDTREYDEADLFATGLGALGDGRPAELFSAHSPRVVDTHFRWMAEAGIDGVGLQRFVSELADPRFLDHRNEVTKNVKAAAEKWGRIFYLEYDVSGAPEGSLVQAIEEDWEQVLEGELGVTQSPQYARQGGRPVVLLWGLGFDDRPGTPAQTAELVQWFHARGCFVGLGVPYEWRTQTGASKPGFLDAYAQADLIQPWAVGAVSNEQQVQSHFAGVVKQDQAWAAQRGVAYQRVIFPGFSWSNWNGGTKNQIPRSAGKFFWKQAYEVRKAGLGGAFIAMFDEYDEGTAIAKAAEDASMAPSSQWFLTLDADGTHVSSDFYLRLAGAATRMIEGDEPVAASAPVPFVVSAPPPPPGGEEPPPGGEPPPAVGDPVPSQLAWSGPAKAFSASSAEVVVQRLYRALLGREADDAGLAGYAPLVASGELDVVVSALVTSAEFDARRATLSAQALAEELYWELLDRAGEPAGLSGTVSLVLEHRLAERAAAMILSEEYASKNP